MRYGFKVRLHLNPNILPLTCDRGQTMQLQQPARRARTVLVMHLE